MGRCPSCEFEVEAGIVQCPNCEAMLLPSGELAPDNPTGTVNQTQGDIAKTFEYADEARSQIPDESNQDEDSGTGTVSAPGVGSDLGDDPDDSPELMDGTVTELEEDEEFEAYEDHASTLIVDPVGGQSPFGGDFGTIGANSNSGSFHAEPSDKPVEADTVDFPMQDFDHPGTEEQGGQAEFSPGGTTVSSSGVGEVQDDLVSETVDYPSSDVPAWDPDATDRANAVTDSPAAGEETRSDTLNIQENETDGRQTHVAADSTASGTSANPDDDAGTVVLPGGESSEGPGDRTVIYDSADSKQSTHPASSSGSGTEGALKRLWAGVAGSSENPMHSLQGIGLQASDSVFQRVATRRVADAQVKDNVTADYQIIDKLGEGAMGIVFSARQTGVDRVVAIKTAKPNYQKNDESRRRFLYEAHITADLDHSNIVPIHELGASEEGMLFYSMKLVKGTEWSRAIRKRTREQNLEIFMKVADAIAFAHSKGVVHRDLKPENTMLGQFGEVFVTDWGTAINLDKDSTLLAEPAAKGDKYITVKEGVGLRKGDTIVLHDGRETFDRLLIHNVDEENFNRLFFKKRLSRDYAPSPKLRVLKAMNLAGTPCYMAPEMAGHQLARIGKTSDIYILGAILFDIVTGRAPHTGDSVTQCLQAALANEIVKADGEEDALLAIAYRAMATDPQDRYQTVEELQDAVREYRRHAESIALSNRAEELLEQARDKSDYETFSRSLFGFRDAIELWPDNAPAVAGLKKARQAFGQAAYAKGDYDLVFQTVDREVPEEAELYEKAEQAKKKAEGRESTLKLLQKVVAAVVLFAVVGLSILSALAFNQSRLARAAEKAALAAKDEADASALEAQLQRDVADTERGKAVTAAAEAKRQEEMANVARGEAEVAANEALKQKGIAEVAQAEAEDAAKEALKQKSIADMQRDKADAAADLAKRRAAAIKLGEYNASLALAKSQIESFDVGKGRDVLAKLKSGNDDVFFGLDPNFNTWGWERINLLSNADLPSTKINGSTSASDYATQAKLAVVGTRQGLIEVQRLEDGRLVMVDSYQHPAATINNVTISPNGKEVVYGYTTSEQSGVMRWELGQKEAQAVTAAGKRMFQQIKFTSDGKKLLAGINGGVWIWQTTEGWYGEEKPTRRIDGLRGALESVQNIDAKTSLLCSRFQEQLLLVLLDHDTAEMTLVKTDELDARLSGSRLSRAVHLGVGNQMVFGLDNNTLLAGTLTRPTATVAGLVELEAKHRAPVTQMVVDGQGQLITASANEPVAHVWKYASGEWSYDTFLTGTAENLAAIALIGDRKIVAVDRAGESIVWDVERQKQRRQLNRQSDGVSEDYYAPVDDVFAGASSGSALTIDRNGVVDLWNLVDGSTQRLSEGRWSYIGHTPGAEFVDSAVDLDQGIVVTAASLRNAEKRYLSMPGDSWEFCIWDARTGAMEKRWTAPNRKRANGQEETIEQRISLLDDGRLVLFASDKQTRFVELLTGRETFSRGDFGSYFAVPNPQDRNLVMLVKRSGSVRMIDLRNPEQTWSMKSYENFALADPSDIPQKGVWSEDGKRFYLTFSTGGLAAFSWSGRDLDLTWSSRKMRDESNNEALVSAFRSDDGRVQSHLDVDLLVSSANEEDEVHIATRSRGVNASTKLTVVRFDLSGKPTLNQLDSVQGIQWLKQSGGGDIALSRRVHDVLEVDSRRIRSRISLNRQTFVSTATAEVFGLLDGEVKVLSYGRGPLVSATGSADGRTLITLHEDGTLWKMSVQTAGGSYQGEWEKLGFNASGARRIALAPSGRQLLVVGEQSSLVDLESGQTIRELGPLAAAAWDPRSSDLAICSEQATIEIVSGGEATTLPTQVNLPEGHQVVDLHYFLETWGDPGRAPRRHLLIHTEDSTQGRWQFVAVDEAPADAPGLIQQAESEMEQLPKGTRIAASPTGGMLVSGDKGGTVTVWFAAPTWESKPRQLFDLEGHRGAAITCLEFSSDGHTIITADEKNRLFGWMSTDPLVAN